MLIVKSDALFSYQPPFNLLAFLILKPASFILSPRALHTTNVFLIKLTSLPILIVIGIYERYFAAGQRFAETGRTTAHTLFNSLPRQIKHMPLVEALVGSSSTDLYEALFEVELTSELDPFEGSDVEDEVTGLRSFASRESFSSARAGVDAGAGRERGGRSRTPTTPRRRNLPSVGPSSPSVTVNPPMPDALEVPGGGNGSNLSPLAMLFGSRMSTAVEGQAAASRAEAAARRVEMMLDDMKGLPVQRLKDEMKDLQVRVFLLFLFIGDWCVTD
ncbi:hypothetical protein H0H81_006950 [Sphagnurus paluster]|uniref:Calcium channel YVC1-like C-terminal transmembrane domain-containing protein n=1 Tax=Sphagnurus paluster TaxID=117069 RepID=A0A9P7FWW7_9AGAR|nr:hypothetical protein H0H81_006950 [Sphagnurus paluster]